VRENVHLLRLATPFCGLKLPAMKLFVYFCAFWLGVASLSWGQAGGVRLDLELEQEQFLSKEKLTVIVRVTNLSGQTLELGQEEDWLTFSVESRENLSVHRLGQPPVGGEFTLDSSRTGTIRVDVSPYFDIPNPGRYRVSAAVKIPQWNSTLSSDPISFEIIRGTSLRELEFGVPPRPGALPGPPEVRKYILQQASYLKKPKLYLRISDVAGSHVFGVLLVGDLVSWGRPEIQLDKFSNAHILHQNGARSFNYCVVHPDGEMLIRQTHEFLNDSRPVLRKQPDGNILVLGGIRRPAPSDLPPIPVATLRSEKPVQPETP
jgi:hypothetical protein